MPTYRYPYSHRCPKRPKIIGSGEIGGNEDREESVNELPERQEEDSTSEAGSYEHYLQFEPAPLTPRDDTESAWEWDGTDEGS